MIKSCLPLLILITFISCKDEINNPPIIESQIFEIEENSPEGTPVGFVVASDYEDDVIYYELMGGSSFPFQLDAITGELTVKQQELLNYEGQEEYEFVVRVYEKERPNYSNSSVIKIHVLDVNEIPVEGLVAYYPFDGGANDKSGNNFNGDVAGASLVEGYDGKNNGAYSFDGLNDYINVGDVDDLKISGDLTISLWLNSKSFSGVRGIITCQADETDNVQTNALYRIAFADTNHLVYTHESGNGYDNIVPLSNAGLELNKWYHIILSRDTYNKEIKYYVNGQYKGSSSYDGNPECGKLSTVRIGMNHGSYYTNQRYFHGVLDEVRIYNRLLKEKEISLLYSLEE